MNRQCGTCTLCCTAVAVLEIRKPVGAPCTELCESGCGIYEDQPFECDQYRCCWLEGRFDESDRPQELGVVFSRGVANGIPIILVSEPAAGAAEIPRVQELIELALSEGSPVVVRNSEQVEKIYPDGRVDSALIDQEDDMRLSIVEGSSVSRPSTG